MKILSILLISLGASLDAFAVSICRGLGYNNFKRNKALEVGIWFGLFQLLMPIFGFNLGFYFESLMYKIDHFIAFFLLLYLGINMILSKNEENKSESLWLLAVATSIDAFSIGMAYAFGYGRDLAYITFLTIGIITFMMSYLGYYIGSKGGVKYGPKAKTLGGIILILIGLKILLEHLL